MHDKVDLFFSHPTPGLTRGWTRCFNILIGRRNGRFRDLAFYNDILPAFRSYLTGENQRLEITHFVANLFYYSA